MLGRNGWSKRWRRRAADMQHREAWRTGVGTEPGHDSPHSGIRWIERQPGSNRTLFDRSRNRLSNQPPAEALPAMIGKHRRADVHRLRHIRRMRLAEADNPAAAGFNRSNHDPSCEIDTLYVSRHRRIAEPAMKASVPRNRIKCKQMFLDLRPMSVVEPTKRCNGR